MTKGPSDRPQTMRVEQPPTSNPSPTSAAPSGTPSSERPDALPGDRPALRGLLEHFLTTPVERLRALAKEAARVHDLEVEWKGRMKEEELRQRGVIPPDKTIYSSELGQGLRPDLPSRRRRARGTWPA